VKAISVRRVEVGKFGRKPTYVYNDLKVTFVNAKVPDVE
jgi:hypothetical protein